MTEAIAIERGSGISLARALSKRHGFTRLAVYERRIDKVIGVVNIKDILKKIFPLIILGNLSGSWTDQVTFN